MDANQAIDEGLINKIQQNITQVMNQIDQAAARGGRRSEKVRLVIVTKGQPVEVIHAAYRAGARLFGENYADQASPKIDALNFLSGVEWHMIGHIQSRKAKLVSQKFSMVHSLDSLKIARRLDTDCQEEGKLMPVLLEFNVAGEESKSGWDASDPRQWDQLLPEIDKVLELQNIRVRGLMAMPPYSEDPENSRPYFQLLSQLRDYLAARFSSGHWDEVSIGTSTDYPIAVEEGATLVRVGQAILGPRHAK